MADEILSRDQNHVTVLGGITDNVAQEIKMLRVDPTTKRLLVSATGLPGAGTVTSVSVVTANGLSGSVATATTTPAITLDISALNATKIADGSVSNTEFQYLDGVSSSIQTQLNAKGSGTVTSVSVTTANGVSGSVATSTTTPAITLTLGAITPTTVNGLTITANGTNTLAITAGKTFSIVKTMSFTAADDTGVYTLPTGTKTLVATDVASLTSLTTAGTTLTVTTGYQIGGAAASGKILVGNGTNYVASTPTFPNASATSGKVIKSDGTNWIASTETYAAPGTSGNVLTSDGTNWTSATPASATPGWILVERIPFSGAATVTTTTIAGNTSGVYMLVIKAIFATNDRLRLKFNAIATGYDNVITQAKTASTVVETNEGTTSAQITAGDSYQDIFANLMIFTRTSYKKQITGTSSAWDSDGTPDPSTFTFNSSLNSTGTEITSFIILSESANNFAAGSEYWLFKQV